MRVLMPLLLLFPSLLANSQSPAPTLRVDFNDCRGKENRRLFRDPDLKLFRLPGKELAYQFRLTRINRDSTYALFGDFKPGIYLVQYKNHFEETITRQYSLNDCGVNRVSLCLDRLEKEPLNMLAGIKDGDSIVIDFSSRGCFHYFSERLVIVRGKDNFTAILEYDHFDTTNYDRKRAVLRRTMGSAHLAAFRRFENELQFVNDGGCTTTDYYDVVAGNEPKRKYTDGSCLWRGFYYLKQALLKEDHSHSRWTLPPNYEPE
jgi:hypothetical protein